MSRSVLGLHAGALLIALFLPTGGGARVGLAAMIVASMGWQRRFGCLAAPAEMELRVDGTCSISSRCTDQKFGGRVVAASVHPGFIRLTVKPAGRRSRVLWVMRDAVEAEIYRELRAGIVQGRLLQRDQAIT